MTLETPLWMQDQTYSGLADRTLIDSVFATAGIIKPGDLVVTQRAAGANMSVDVAAGSVVVAGTDVSEQGKYLNRSSAVTNVAIATAPGSGNSRIDVIYARDIDEDAIGGSTNDWIISVVAGTASGSPSVPAIPASSIALAHVLVGTSVTSIVNANITDTRVLATTLASPSARLVSTSSMTPGPDTIEQVVGLAQDFATGITVGTNQLTVITAGIYNVSAAVQWSGSSAGGLFECHVYVNGSNARQWIAEAGSSDPAAAHGSDIIKLAAGDVVQLWAAGNNGFGVLNTQIGFCWLSLSLAT